MMDTSNIIKATTLALKHQIKTAPYPADKALADMRLEELYSKISDQPVLLSEIKDNQGLQNLLAGVFGNSAFISALIIRQPSHFIAAINANPQTYVNDLKLNLQNEMENVQSQAEAMMILRVFKQNAALFIALADLSEIWSVIEVYEAVTQIADEAIKQSVNYLLHQAALKGDYLPEDINNIKGQDSGYIILAMGKQGASELNYSSDVDLIIFFDKERIRLKETVEPSKFFVALTRNLVKLMQEQTADGYVFRVDLRLRPDPGATQIALSTAAAYTYYEGLGQNWERAAMIKARPVAGDIEAGKIFLEGLAPFIWRKYLDFAAIDDIHAMKRQIHTFKGHAKIAIEGHNLKLGRGGIREIEFFAQTQQLIAAGRQVELRTIKTLDTLKVLVQNKWIKSAARDELSEAYCFLRRIEHRLQMLNDEQTHSLPSDEVGMQRIANFSGYLTIEEFSQQVRQRLETVQQHYQDLFEDDASLSGACGNLLFVGDAIDPDTMQTLSQLGFNDPELVIKTVRSWHFGRYISTRSERARERLTEFQPLLIEALSKTSQPDYALSTFDRFLKGLPAGIQLFSMLSSNPNLLNLVAEIMGTAPSLARILSRRTRILDAVLDPGFFGDLPDDDQLHAIIEQQFSTCHDYEDTLDRARSIGQEQSFLIGVRFLSAVINAQQAAAGYTRLAEAVIVELQTKVENEMQEQHGSFIGAAVSVLAMGKLGGCEMTASSDLDLILIYDFEAGQTQSDGKKPLSPTQYYARFTQRLIAALSAPTAEGELYEVDMRLRPSGRAGPVATHIDSFIKYQNNNAWVWEHMALTRARPISGPRALQERLNQTIFEIISKPRDASSLVKDVIDMRERIAKEKGSNNIWNIKQVRGGLIDLEFICQFLQLCHGHAHPQIITNNISQSFLAMKQTGIVSDDDIHKLVSASESYSSLIQMIRLCTQKGFNPETAGEGLKQRLAKSLNLPSFLILSETLTLTQSEVRNIFHKLLKD